MISFSVCLLIGKYQQKVFVVKSQCRLWTMTINWKNFQINHAKLKRDESYCFLLDGAYKTGRKVIETERLDESSQAQVSPGKTGRVDRSEWGC